MLAISSGSYLALSFTSSQALCVEPPLLQPIFCQCIAPPCTTQAFGDSPTSRLTFLKRIFSRSKTTLYPAGFKSQKVPDLNLPKCFPPHKISVLLSGKQTVEQWSLHLGLKNKKHLPEINSDELDCPPLGTVQMLIMWGLTDGKENVSFPSLPWPCFPGSLGKGPWDIWDVTELVYVAPQGEQEGDVHGIPSPRTEVKQLNKSCRAARLRRDFPGYPAKSHSEKPLHET